MSNSIEYAKKFLPIIDEVYQEAAITQIMDSATKADFNGANEVKVLKVSTTGLGDYSREGGYPKGDVTATWENMALTEERGKEISIDRMDNEETLGQTFGAVTGDFMRLHVIPELDAYRFAKYAGTAGISTAHGALTKDTILAAIDAAVQQMDADEVPLEGRILYVNSNLKPVLNSALARQWGSDAAVNTVLAGYNDMEIKYVPASRFFTKVEINDGTDNWGFQKAADGLPIQFMLVSAKAVLQVKKFVMPKIFTPDENQEKDAWKFQFRLYHDAFVFQNKVKGIYLHTAEA